MNRHHRHRMSFGATLLDDAVGHPSGGRGALFRLYAPRANDVALLCELPQGERRIPTQRTPDGFHEVVVSEARAGTRYAFAIDGIVAPDPAARFAPDGIHGRSMVMDPLAFEWTDDSWEPRAWSEYVLYELHVGTFTPEGTYHAAAEKLDDLVSLGITAVELMPLAQAAGHRNWGYDGVLLYAPAHDYGTPDDLKAFVVAAHERNLAVFLDVVYNHFGPEGNYLHGYAPEFYAEEIHTPWGAAIDLQADDRESVRAFFYENALYWLEEFRFDGLRFDAIDTIYDGPERRFMTEIADLISQRIPRPVYLVVENDRNEASLLEAGFRAQWNDDAHHAAHVIATGQIDGYYSDYRNDAIGLLGRSMTQGFIYQGQPSPYRQGKTRGFPSGHLELNSFVTFLQNHDQVGNRPFGDRIASLASVEALRAMLGVMLLGPSIPLLFMGEEWAASTPFLFFCDFEPDLAKKVTEGRRNEFKSFAEFARVEARERIPDPSSPQPFRDSALRWEERTKEPHRTWLAYYSELLALRAKAFVPRFAHLRGESSHYERYGEFGLHAEYALATGERLKLDANLGPRASDEPPHAHAGETLFATHAGQPTPLPAWYVRWSVR